MKQTLTILFLLVSTFLISAQNFDDLTFGTDSTFEVVTWNIEWFPKNGETTIDYVTQIIEALDVDLLAIQEVDNISSFNQLIDGLDGYEGYLESSYFAGLAYIYKTDVIQINDIYEIYTTYPYWSPFPRSPMVMDLNYGNERIIVINNHFKCCGDGILNLEDPDDEETRRNRASTLLKEYIEEYFTNTKTILLGDLNDDLADDPVNNVFQLFLNDTENYWAADLEIAHGSQSGWSYPTWPSHLDHIFITNELFEEFGHENALIQTIKIDEFIDGGWWEYDQNISDHRPVGIKLKMNSNLGDSELEQEELTFFNYPNPFNSKTFFSFSADADIKEIEIFNMTGKKVFSERISSGQTRMRWNADGLPVGVYFARLTANPQEVAFTKLLLVK